MLCHYIHIAKYENALTLLFLNRFSFLKKANKRYGQKIELTKPDLRFSLPGASKNRKPPNLDKANLWRFCLFAGYHLTFFCINFFVSQPSFFNEGSKFVYCKGVCPDEAGFLIYDAPWRQKSKTTYFWLFFAYNFFVSQPIFFKLKTKIVMAKLLLVGFCNWYINNN